MLITNFFIVLVLFCSIADASSRHFAKGIKIECDSDPTICKDPICDLKYIKRGIMRMRYGCTPVVPSYQLWVRFLSMKKTYTNHFMPGLFDITRDFCEISLPNTIAMKFVKTLLSNIHPQAWEAYEKLLRPCPYKDTFYFEMMHNEQTSVPPAVFHPSGEYKLHIRYFNENNQTLLGVNMYYKLNNEIF